jgi:multidrug transporter EmrE-like cation transporter
VAWLSLLVAGLFEIAWAIGLKYTNGFTRLWPTSGTIIALILSFVFLEYAVRTLPVGTAYESGSVLAPSERLRSVWFFSVSRENHCGFSASF